MEKIIEVNNMKIEQGTPKIAVPIVGSNLDEILKEVKIACKHRPDIIEWRIDYLTNFNIDEIKNIGEKIASIIKNEVLLITLRTKNEGGNQEISAEDYFKMMQFIIKNKLSAMVDIEYSQEKENVDTLVEAARVNGIKTVLSYHNFDNTPENSILKEKILSMSTINADIIKLALMPQKNRDVIRLMYLTSELNLVVKQSLVTMSMGKLGRISRIIGNKFDSSITFAAIEKTSAPGQIQIDTLRRLMNQLE